MTLNLKSLILVKTLLIFNFGCQAIDKTKTEPPPKSETVIFAPYDKVWRASQLALSKYPLSVSNMDAGKIITGPIEGALIWQPVHQSFDTQGLQAKIQLQLTRGKVNGKEAIKIEVNKKLVRKLDFFSGNKEIPTEAYEEESLLYRIKRELIIEAVIDKLAETNNSSF